MFPTVFPANVSVDQGRSRNVVTKPIGTAGFEPATPRSQSENHGARTTPPDTDSPHDYRVFGGEHRFPTEAVDDASGGNCSQDVPSGESESRHRAGGDAFTFPQGRRDLLAGEKAWERRWLERAWAVQAGAA